jgi:hypothetical protein
MLHKRISGWFWLILAAYGLLAVAASVIVPLAESPDELDHFLYVRYLANNGRFPVMDPVAEKNETMEANQPPLYYLLGTAVSGWVDMQPSVEMPLNQCFSFDPQDSGRQTFYRHDTYEQFPYQSNALAFHLVRLLSVLLGAGTVGLAYTLGVTLAGGDEQAGLLAAGLLAFNPQFIFITGSVNNDVLTALLGAAILWQSIRVAHQPLPKRVLFLAVLVGLGLLTKFALLALWPVAITAVLIPLMQAWKPGEKNSAVRKVLRSLAINLIIVLGLPLMVAGWWYVRTQRLYGDILAWDVHLQAKGAEVLRATSFATADLFEFASYHFRSSWGLFGWLNVQVPTWMFVLYAGLALIAFVGLVMEVWSWRSLWHGDSWLVKGQQLLTEKAAFLLSTLAVVAVYISLLRYIQTINWSGYQGRLAFSVAAAVAALLALGLRQILLKRAWLVRFTLGTLFILAMCAVFGVMVPAYPKSTIYEPSPDVAQICARFDDGLMLDGVDFPASIVPGDEMTVMLYGYGLKEASVPKTLMAVVNTADGQPVAQTDVDLTWATGEVLQIPLHFSIDESMAPAKAFLQLSLLDGSKPLLPTNADGTALAVPFTAGLILIGPERPFFPQPQVETNAVFGEQVQLVGYDWVEEEDELVVTLYWQALSTPLPDYTTFIHLLDDAGNLVTQADSQPQNGRYPMSVWAPGEIVADTKYISLPAERPLAVTTGIYLLETGQRLMLSEEASNSLPLLTLKVED